MTHFEGKVRVQAILEKDGKVLLVRDHHDADIWDVPAGRMDTGENVEDALAREVREELGIDSTFNAFVCSGQGIHFVDMKNYLFISCSMKSDDFGSMQIPSEEIAEIRWVTREEMEMIKMYDCVRDALHIYWKQ